MKYAKAIVAAVGAALLTLSESGVFVDKPWFQAVIAWATVFGVYRIRNAE